MGHVVNPISFRLYFSRYWNSNWYSSNNYSFFFFKDLQLNEYFYSFFHIHKRNRRYFYRKFMFDSLDIFKKSNKYYITLDVFDYRIKTYPNLPYYKKYYQAKLYKEPWQRPSLYRVSRGKRDKYLFKRLFAKFNKRYRSLPWLYKRYISKLLLNFEKRNTKKNKPHNYIKKFFIAYIIYSKYLNLDKNPEILIKSSLKILVLNILSTYYKFLGISSSPSVNLLSDYSDFLYNTNSLLKLNYVNNSVLKEKIKKIKVRLNSKSLEKNKLKQLKFYSGVFNNLFTIRNLILKYKNLLILTNKRIEFYNYKYDLQINWNNRKKNGFLKNLYWRRDRLISLIYFLRKKSNLVKEKYKSDITSLKDTLNKLVISKVNNNLFLKINQLKFYNLFYKKYIYLFLFFNFSRISSLFLVNRYLNLLDKTKLLRFNYRFSMYKQSFLKLLNLKKNLNFYKQNWFFQKRKKSKKIMKSFFADFFREYPKRGVVRGRRRYRYPFISKKEILTTIQFNRKVSKFLGIFNLKLSELDLNFSDQNINKLEISSTFFTINNIVKGHIDSLDSLLKKKKFLKSVNKASNYKYFLQFLALNQIYSLKDKSKTFENSYNFTNILKSILVKLRSKKYNLNIIKSYLKKKYVYLLFKQYYRNQGLLKNLNKKFKFYGLKKKLKLNYRFFNRKQKLRSKTIKPNGWLLKVKEKKYNYRLSFLYDKPIDLPHWKVNKVLAEDSFKNKRFYFRKPRRFWKVKKVKKLFKGQSFKNLLFSINPKDLKSWMKRKSSMVFFNSTSLGLNRERVLLKKYYNFKRTTKFFNIYFKYKLKNKVKNLLKDQSRKKLLLSSSFDLDDFEYLNLNEEWSDEALIEENGFLGQFMQWKVKNLKLKLKAKGKSATKLKFKSRFKTKKFFFLNLN